VSAQEQRQELSEAYELNRTLEPHSEAWSANHHRIIELEKALGVKGLDLGLKAFAVDAAHILIEPFRR
jgi:hypothetical protein